MKARKNSPAATTSPLVLVVDDFDDNRSMYVEYLQFHGFRVAEATDGEQAVARAKEVLPDVIVMDLSLPVLDGWEATRRLKADGATKHAIVIALTGHAEAAHARRAREAGCDDFVPKPCLPEQLVARIQQHVGSAPSSGMTPKAKKGSKG